MTEQEKFFKLMNHLLTGFIVGWALFFLGFVGRLVYLWLT